MIITERRIVEQNWYESEDSKTGWENNGWCFHDTGRSVERTGYEIVQHLESDKFGNTTLGIAEKQTKIKE